ncbi:MAG: hypothetical protein M1813_007194 [Trichoglossum hirsutum]|nr:MAG: hypothetical protein M1813_007194 [Trichoglossum hirsutum]
MGLVQHWVSVLLAVYGAALLSSAPVFGWFADYSRSRRVPLLLGLVALGGATALLCIGSTIALLVVGRLLQGISAAVVWTVGLALLVDTVGQNEVGQAMGYVNLSMSLGVLVAPLLGGVVYEKGGYYSVFGMAFGLVGLDIVLRLMLVEKKIASQWTTTSGGVEYGTMMVSQEGHIEQVQEPPMERRDTPPPDGPVGSPDAGGPHAHPSPVVTMLKSRRLLAALWGCLVQAALMTSFDSCAFAGGTLVGPIWGGFIESKAGWGTMGWSLGLLSALSAIPAVSQIPLFTV